MKDKPTDKKPKAETPRGKYEEELVVKGSFFDIIQASVKNANDKTAEKKKNEPKSWLQNIDYQLFASLGVNGYSYQIYS